MQEVLRDYTNDTHVLDATSCFRSVADRNLASYVSGVTLSYVVAKAFERLRQASSSSSDDGLKSVTSRLVQALTRDLLRRFEFERYDAALEDRLFAQRDVAKTDVFQWYEMMTPEEKALVREIKVSMRGNPTAEDLQELFKLKNRKMRDKNTSRGDVEETEHSDENVENAAVSALAAISDKDDSLEMTDEGVSGSYYE
jgi:hypothetical protein